MIYLSPPSMTELERTLVLEAFDSNWVAPLGPFVDRFERELAALAGREHAVALSSGTAALHLSLLLAGVQPGDEVLVSTLTFAATANAVTYCGAVPVFIDSEPETWNMDPALLEQELREARAAGRRIGAVVPVDLYGQCADYDELERICAEYEVPLISDAAEAVGASYKGRPAGSFGPFAVFSFNGNKIITTGGGGALLTDDAEAAARARYLATQARMPAEHYEHTEVGFNYRLSNLLAAVGCGQLERLPEILQRRREIRETYEALLADMPGVSFSPVSANGSANNWLTVMLLDPELGDGAVLAVLHALRALECEARRVWKPMHLQPVFAANRFVASGVSDSVFTRGVCLPSGTDLEIDQQEAVVAAIIGVLELAIEGSI
jgi:dTDP-4-amino-4,6-dideoxygalactose transaminase